MFPKKIVIAQVHIVEILYRIFGLIVNQSENIEKNLSPGQGRKQCSRCETIPIKHFYRASLGRNMIFGA